MLSVSTLSVFLPSLRSSSRDWARGSVDRRQTTASIGHSLFMIVLAKLSRLYGTACGLSKSFSLRASPRRTRRTRRIYGQTGGLSRYVLDRAIGLTAEVTSESDGISHL